MSWRAPFSRGVIIVSVEVVIELGQRIAVGDHLGTMGVRRGHHVVAVDARVIENIELGLLKACFEGCVIEMEIVGPRRILREERRCDYNEGAPKLPNVERSLVMAIYSDSAATIQP